MRRRQRLLLLAVALGATLLGLVVHATGALRRTELDTVDARSAIRGERPPPRDVLLVVIDERTIQALAKRYPFPRRYHARAMDLLHDAGARVIAYDVTFVEPTTEEDDGRLLDALDRDRPVLLAATAVDDHGRTNVLGDPALVRE